MTSLATTPIAVSWASRKLASATVISTATPRRSRRASAASPKRSRTQSPGVTKPRATATGRSRGTRAWNTTRIDIMKPVAMIQEKPRR